MLSEKRNETVSPSSTSQAETTSAQRITGSTRQSVTSSDSSPDKKIPPAPPLPLSMSAQSMSSTPRQNRAASRTTSESTSEQPVVVTKVTYPTITQRSLPRQTSSDDFADRNVQKNAFGSSSYRDVKKRPSPTVTRVSARDVEQKNFPTISKLVTSIPLARPAKSNHQSIFEKVDPHTREVSYLGSGTYENLEDCIRRCLARDRSYKQISHYTPRNHLSSSKSLTRASVLEDYSYEGVDKPRHHYHHHHHQHYDCYPSDGYRRSDSYLHHLHHHPKSAADLSLTEIRQINDALAKYGISVFSHQDPYNNLYRRERNVGDIISACQHLIDDPAFQSYRNNHQSVNNVWNQMQNSSPYPNANIFGQTAVRDVASHLFNPNYQPPYNPAPSVASNFYNTPNQGSYPPINPPPPSSSTQNVLANLFNPPNQGSYPSNQGSYPPMNQPPPPPNNSARNVLASLFSSPTY